MTMGTRPAAAGRVAEDMPRWVARVLVHVLAVDADAPTLRARRIRGEAALARRDGSLRVLAARRAAAVEFNILLGTLALLPIFLNEASAVVPSFDGCAQIFLANRVPCGRPAHDVS